MKKNKTSVLFIAFLIALTFHIFNNQAYSYPKFAALTGEKCQSCHVNPTGGGIRNSYGVKYSKDKLYMKFLKKANELTDFNPQLTKAIQIGADMRMIFIDDQQGEGVPNFNSFFQMQGDLYVNVKMNKYLSLMIAPGLYIPSTFGQSPLATKYEIYGMVSNLPAGLYFKAGRFLPNFGIKIPEHRAYNRQFNDFYTPYASDAGLEVGFAPSFFTLTAGISNGSTPNRNGIRNNSFDFDNQKQFVASGDFRWATKNGKFAVGLGGSFLTNPFKYDPTKNTNALRQIAGGFISIGLFERVAILGELDYNRLDIRDSVDTRKDMQTIFGEVDITVVKGLEVKFQVENYEPQLGIKKGNLEARRFSFGIGLFPMTGLEIESIFRIVDEPGVTVNPSTGAEEELDVKNNEFQTTFKFYF
jgi:hypothetical protein